MEMGSRGENRGRFKGGNGLGFRVENGIQG